MGETKKKISTRLGEHEKDIFKGNWKSSGAVEHAKSCDAGIKWDSAETVAVEPEYHRWKIRESLEIHKQKTGPAHSTGMNRDNGTCVRSSWNSIFRSINLKSKLENYRSG